MDQKFDEMNIFALREYARRVGVSAPTAKKKEDIITAIIEIQEGKRKPDFSQKHGRPPKNNNITFIENRPNLTQTKDSFTHIRLEQNTNPFTFDNITTVSGYVEKINNTAILWHKNNYHYDWIYIVSEVVMSSNIQTGDYITGELGISDNQPCVTKIFTINTCPITKFNANRNSYNELKHTQSSEKIKFSNQEYANLNLLYGENVYFYGTNNNSNTTTIVNLINSCKTDKVLYLNVSLAEKNLSYIEPLTSAELFVSRLTDSTDYAKRMILLCMERAKRLFEDGKKVVIVIDDVPSLLEIDSGDKLLTKSVISLTKNSLEAGSITLWAIMKDSNHFDKLCDKRVRIDGNNLISLN